MSLKSKIIKIKRILFEKNSLDIFNNKRIFNHLKTSETNDYSIFRCSKRNYKVLAAYDKSILIKKNNTIILQPSIHNKILKFKIEFNEKKFPGLISGSKIDLCMFLPYMREVEKSKYVKLVRLNIITDKGQIYHNYPARLRNIEGYYLEEDIINFEESAIWDLPTAKYPSKNEKCECFERFYPGLPNENYLCHPLENTNDKFIDIYKNGGFGKCFEFCENGEKKVLPRFYIYSRHQEANSFHFIGNPISDSKMNLIATYRSNRNVGVRVCIFASDDGGRSWFNKYEFADSGCYEFMQGDETTWGHNYGNQIKNENYNEIYTENTIFVRKRELLYNQNEKFKWYSPIKIKEILNLPYLTFKTEVKHNFKNGNIIALGGNIDNSLKWLINNDINSNTNGKNLLFKVKIIDDFTFELRECVSQSTHNISCRHIHHVNRIKDGWIIGTGEIYPNGWLLYMQMKEADTFAIKKAFEYFEIVRLNSSPSSVQRTMGVIMKEDDDSCIMYASDHDTLEMVINKPLSNIANKDLSRNSTGVYLGKLEDINDRTKFKCIYEAVEPCFFFQKIDGVFVFCGQRGELALSFDGGKNWKMNKISTCFMNYYGSICNIHFFDNYIIIFK